MEKKHLFTEEQNAIAKTADALSNPARVAIVTYLLDVQGRYGYEIFAHIPLVQSTVSVHLRTLRQASVIECRGVKSSMFYFIDKVKIRQLADYLKTISDALVV